MLSLSKLPLSYWSYLVAIAVHIINRLPSPNLHNQSPWEPLFHSMLDLTHLRVFGCTCFPLLKPYIDHKLQPHTKHCLELITHRVYISRYVLFNENEFLCAKSSSLSTSSLILAEDSPFCTFPTWLSYMLHTSPPPTCTSLPNSTPHMSTSPSLSPHHSNSTLGQSISPSPHMTTTQTS